MHRNMGPHNVKTASQAIQRLLNGYLIYFCFAKHFVEVRPTL